MTPTIEQTATAPQQTTLTERDAMTVLIAAAQELAAIKYRHFQPGEHIPPGIREELKHHALLIEAAKVAQNLSWWQD
jgi:hypothetical protein